MPLYSVQAIPFLHMVSEEWIIKIQPEGDKNVVKARHYG
jgi:hypothetical protein